MNLNTYAVSESDPFGNVSIKEIKEANDAFKSLIEKQQKDRLLCESIQEIGLIYSHPSNIKELRKRFSKEQENLEDQGIMTDLGGIQIVSSRHMEQYKLKEPLEWERTDKLKDSKFVTWVEDLENTPSWAVYFGLVERKKELVFYAVNRPRHTVLRR